MMTVKEWREQIQLKTHSIQQQIDHDVLPDFKKGMQREIKIYFQLLLKDERQWDNFRRATKAQALAQGLSEILDPNYKPMYDSTEPDLFKLKQNFIHSVCERTIQIDGGKTNTKVVIMLRRSTKCFLHAQRSPPRQHFTP